MRTFRIIGLILIATIIFGSGIDTQNQTDGNYWVFQIHESPDQYTVIRMNAHNGVTDTVYAVPKTTPFNMITIMSEEELAVADEFLADSLYTTDPQFSIHTFFDKPGLAFLQSISPSPDGNTLAILVIYQLCTLYPRMECFGVNEIILLDLHTGTDTTLWRLPMQANTSYYPYCVDTVTYPAGNDATLFNMRWTPDQTSIIVEINYSRQHPDNPTIMIPINSPTHATVVGNGDQGWATNANSSEIASISLDCVSGNPYAMVVHVTEFNSGQTITMDYSLGSFISNIFPDIGPAYLGNRVIFGVSLLNPERTDSELNRIAILDPSATEPLTIIDTPIPKFMNLQSSPSREVLVVEDGDNMLWTLNIQGDEFSLKPITSAPVTYWHFANDEELVVQFAGDTGYSIIRIPEATS